MFGLEQSAKTFKVKYLIEDTSSPYKIVGCPPQSTSDHHIHYTFKHDMSLPNRRVDMV